MKVIHDSWLQTISEINDVAHCKLVALYIQAQSHLHLWHHKIPSMVITAVQ